MSSPITPHIPASPPAAEARSLKELSPSQWRSGIAAWLGWMFDGLDMHLYTLVAAPFVMLLVGAATMADPDVKEKSAYIQAAFLVGWALGGGFFGRLGDVLGRSKALSLTILTYALFTGLSFFATTWWQLMIFRFIAALGIGGEWAVGSSLLSETWPKKWRPWIAAVLQTGVNLGVLLACAANYFMKAAPGWPQSVFLVGVIPAFLVFWIRKAVPEPEEWKAEKKKNAKPPAISDLFRGDVLRITVCTIIVCATSLTAWWGFMFWNVQHLRSLPSVLTLTEQQKEGVATLGLFLPIGISIVGNFFAGWMAKLFGYRKAIAIMSCGFFLSFLMAYYKPRDHGELLFWVGFIGFFSGMFGLFTMFLPPLFPTLLRTTGAGFCYNIGRIAAAAGTIVFGLYAKVGDFRMALLCAGFLFIPTIIVAQMLPEPKSLHE
jgi:MFS family permease